jgi:hypothetical protein
MKNNLRTVGYTSLKIYRVQVVWIEADYCFPLTAQDDEVLEGKYSVVARRKIVTCRSHLIPQMQKGISNLEGNLTRL